MRYRSPLGRLIPNRQDPEQTKREGWQEHGILVIAADDERLDGWDREWVRHIGNRLYGEKKA